MKSLKKIQNSTVSILWVEDDHFSAIDISRYFQDIGYNVYHAEGIKECLNILKNHGGKIDIAIIDVMLKTEKPFSEEETFGGRRTGVVLGRYIQELYPKIKIIGASQIYDEEVFEWFNKLANGFIIKPYNIKVLSKSINKSINPNNYLIGSKKVVMFISLILGLLSSIVTLALFFKNW
ncbi:MAG: response regulator [Candidatus Electrothrix sp. AS4_5]|nr:response regulator [Candidatus Electrothrix gigas]